MRAIVTGSGYSRVRLCPPSAVLPRVDHHGPGSGGSAMHDHLALRTTRGLDVAMAAIPDIAALWGLSEEEAGIFAARCRSFDWMPPAGAIAEFALAFKRDGSVIEVEGGRGRYELPDDCAGIAATIDLVYAEPAPITWRCAACGRERWDDDHNVDGQCESRTFIPECPQGSKLFVLDFKTGAAHNVEPIASNRQLMLAAALAGYFFGAAEVVPAVLFVRKGPGVLELPEYAYSPDDLAAIVRDLQETLGRIARARAQLAAREPLDQLVEGDHCGWCHSFTACPAKTAMIAALAGIEREPLEPGELPLDLLRRGVEIAGALERMAKRIKALGAAHVEAHGPIPLAPGKLWGPNPHTKKTLDPDLAWPILVEELGAEAAAQAVERTVSRESIRRTLAERELPDKEVNATLRRIFGRAIGAGALIEREEIWHSAYRGDVPVGEIPELVISEPRRAGQPAPLLLEAGPSPRGAEMGETPNPQDPSEVWACCGAPHGGPGKPWCGSRNHPPAPAPSPPLAGKGLRGWGEEPETAESEPAPLQVPVLDEEPLRVGQPAPVDVEEEGEVAERAALAKIHMAPADPPTAEPCKTCRAPAVGVYPSPEGDLAYCARHGGTEAPIQLAAGDAPAGPPTVPFEAFVGGWTDEALARLVEAPVEAVRRILAHLDAGWKEERVARYCNEGLDEVRIGQIVAHHAHRRGPGKARCPGCEILIRDVTGEAPAAIPVRGVWCCSDCVDSGRVDSEGRPVPVGTLGGGPPSSAAAVKPAQPFLKLCDHPTATPDGHGHAICDDCKTRVVGEFVRIGGLGTIVWRPVGEPMPCGHCIAGLAVEQCYRHGDPAIVVRALAYARSQLPARPPPPVPSAFLLEVVDPDRTEQIAITAFEGVPPIVEESRGGAAALATVPLWELGVHQEDTRALLRLLRNPGGVTAVEWGRGGRSVLFRMAGRGCAVRAEDGPGGRYYITLAGLVRLFSIFVPDPTAAPAPKASKPSPAPGGDAAAEELSPQQLALLVSVGEARPRLLEIKGAGVHRTARTLERLGLVTMATVAKVTTLQLTDLGTAKFRQALAAASLTPTAAPAVS